MGMLRTAAVTAGAFLTATIALAVGDIPTMYVGSFPSVTRISGITGTFNGTSLVIKGFGTSKGGAVAGRFACSRTSPAQTQCTGFVTKDNGQPLDNPTFRRRHLLEITWSAGQPVAMTARIM
jgi:hypothetical protein